MNPLTEKLRHHVTGAIERGESQAIAGITQNQHTPGPWRWEDKTLIGSNDCFVDKDDAADARLIAAAPELLSALETIVSSYGELMRSKGAKSNLGQDFSAADWLGSRLGGHIAKAEDLIMRAKGEA